MISFINCNPILIVRPKLITGYYSTKETTVRANPQHTKKRLHFPSANIYFVNDSALGCKHETLGPLSTNGSRSATAADTKPHIIQFANHPSIDCPRSSMLPDFNLLQMQRAVVVGRRARFFPRTYIHIYRAKSNMSVQSSSIFRPDEYNVAPLVTMSALALADWSPRDVVP